MRLGKYFQRCIKVDFGDNECLQAQLSRFLGFKFRNKTVCKLENKFLMESYFIANDSSSSSRTTENEIYSNSLIQCTSIWCNTAAIITHWHSDGLTFPSLTSLALTVQAYFSNRWHHVTQMTSLPNRGASSACRWTNTLTHLYLQYWLISVHLLRRDCKWNPILMGFYDTSVWVWQSQEVSREPNVLIQMI